MIYSTCRRKSIIISMLVNLHGAIVIYFVSMINRRHSFDSEADSMRKYVDKYL